MKIDFGLWKEYAFPEIFEIRKGFYNKKPEHTVEGKIPFLGATEKNNGVTEYYSIEDIENASKTGNGKNQPLEVKLFPPNALCVTNNGSVGFAFYQKEIFTCSHDVNPLYLKDGELNEYTALFVASVIKQDRYRWAYGRKWRPERMMKSKIFLPSNKNGDPDWEYMERYIKSLHFKHLSTNNKKQNGYINSSEWMEYRVGDLFEIINGKGITQDEIESNPGTLKAVQSGEENNGIMGTINEEYCKLRDYTYTKEPCLTVARSGSAGYVSYQERGCVVGDSAKILILKERMFANKYVYLFFKTILMASKYKYTYGRKVTAQKYLNEIIRIPVDKEGKPDYQYMEKYIRNLPYGDRL